MADSAESHVRFLRIRPLILGRGSWNIAVVAIGKPSKPSAHVRFRRPQLILLCLWPPTMVRVFLLLLISVPAVHGRADQPVDFAHDIVPILKSHCVICHGGREHEGDFSLNTRHSVLESGMIVAGDPAASHLIELVTSSDADQQMPPSDRPRLSAPEVDQLRRWIAADLPWNADFTFAISGYEPPLKPRTVQLPSVSQGRNHPIDRLLDAGLTEHQSPVPPPISDDRFLRRVTMDLVGLLPTVDQRNDFHNDSRPDKRAERVAQLLDRDIEYADHWLSFFNDLLRNDYSGTGFITGGRRQISKWLYQSLLDNKPYDQMTRELIAPPSIDSQGYIDGIKWRGNVSAGQTVEVQFSQSISQSFLGINMKCASCHDSFVDRWTLKEAYGLAAIYADAPLLLHRCDKPTGEQQEAAWLFPELGRIDPQAPRDKRLQQLSRLVTHPENGRFTRTIVNRLWHRLMGRGIVHPLDAMQTEPWNADLLDYLANHLADHNYDLKATLQLITTSQAYQSATEIQDDRPAPSNYVYRGPRARRITAEQFLDAVWQLTDAAPHRFDAPVVRHQVTQAELDAVQVTGKWVWGPLANNQAAAEQSLLIRTIVDLPSSVQAGSAVITCDNEFQCYIADREVASGTDWTQLQLLPLRDVLKKGRNTIVFRVRNAGSPGQDNPAGLFFEARLTLADGSGRTISSDDSWQYQTTVPASEKGRLVSPRDGWKPVTVAPTLPVWANVIQEQGRPLLSLAALSNDLSPVIRASLLKNTPLMQALGRPLRDQIVSMRPTDLTTLEAIDLANESTLAKVLEKGGQYWSGQSWVSTDALVRTLFVTALTREPTPSERVLFTEFLGEAPDSAALSDALWAVCMLPEFLLIR